MVGRLKSRKFPRIGERQHLAGQRTRDGDADQPNLQCTFVLTTRSLASFTFILFFTDATQ